MCGIAGFWNLDNAPVNIKMLDLFTDSLAHRGPDGRGVFIDDTVALGLGHRRLSIIDTTTIAHQPMEYSDGRYQITFNGEIYNFIELKKELIVAGYSFSTESDTEIILAAYDKWGEECQLKFNGMWAFALWDKKEKKLFLSRDRFGVKPLYYCFDGIHFAFASEMKAFLALKWFDPSFDEVVVASVINGATLDGTDICLLKNLKRLPGGFSISLQENTGPVLKRWWNTLDHLVEIPKTYEEQVARYRELFLEACLLRMRSDVPIGTSLSGGLDSSSSICGMKRVRDTWKNSERGASDWQKAFVALYPGTLQDEEKYAEIVIKYTRVHPVYCEITPKTLLDHYKEIIFQFESISEIPIGPWILYNAQRENGVVVSVDGHGGDEALGGYHHYPEALMRQEMALGFFHLFKFYQYRSLLQRLFVNPKMCNAPDLTEFLFRNLVGFMTSMMNILKSALLSTPNATECTQRKDRPVARWLTIDPVTLPPSEPEEDSKKIQARDLLFRMLYHDFHYGCLPVNLHDYDIIAMGHGVEVRSPFLDWQLVCYTFSLPSQTKIGKGVTKRILRDALEDILPEEVRTRTSKIGFANPVGEWIREDLKSMILSTLESAEFQECSMWDGKTMVKDVHGEFNNSNYANLGYILKFVQTIYLMTSFNQMRRQYMDTLE